MRTTLYPSLWRTCRALANHPRLRAIELLQEHGELTVTQMAERTGCPVSEASVRLRALNARGLLRVHRDGRNVIYSIGSDPSVSGSEELLRSVLKILKTGRQGRVRVFRAVTALTHERRHRILFALKQENLTFKSLQARSSISKRALRRHLRKLRARGLVTWRNGTYRCTRPRDQLRKTLLLLASQPP